jgi:hypothetical protein
MVYLSQFGLLEQTVQQTVQTLHWAVCEQQKFIAYNSGGWQVQGRILTDGSAS